MALPQQIHFHQGGWPDPKAVQDTLPAHSGHAYGSAAELEVCHVGRRVTEGTSTVWDLGITALTQVPFIFRNGVTDFDAAPPAHKDGYKAVPYGGINGVSFANTMEVDIATYDTVTTPAVGDTLYADTDGVLKVATQEDGTLIAASKVQIATVVKGPFSIGTVTFIRIAPLRTFSTSAAS